MSGLRHIILFLACMLNCVGHAQDIANEFGYPVMPSVSSVSTDPVGTPFWSFSVSPTGGANCVFPIEVASGINGLQPDLSILYNSQTGNSLAGYGCILTGVSAITRGCQDIYHDGKAHGTGYGSSDAFYLDGQRLIYMRSLANGDSIKYCLEHSPYTGIWLIGANQPPAQMRFMVETPDGRIHHYATLLIHNSGGTNNGKV